ncbi:MAG: diacylglycerol/lipid kinase family protein [Devosia sp.]
MEPTTVQKMSYHVLLNASAGTANATGVTAAELEQLFAGQGLAATIDDRRDLPLDRRIAEAVKGKADVIVAAGGDGTITALAGALVDSNKSLAILPLGTVNALAKDLHVPLDLPGAVAAIATGETHRIDVGEVNGRIFLHKVVIGVIPGVAAGRERIRGREGTTAKFGFLLYFLRRLARARRMAVAIEADNGPRRIERAQALAVASNSYDEGLGQFFSRSSLDKGTLTLYVVHHFTVGDVFRLTTRMLLGRWQDDEALTIETVQAVSITTHKKLLKVMLDGEIETVHTPLDFRIRQKALSVIVPAEQAVSTGAAEAA